MSSRRNLFFVAVLAVAVYVTCCVCVEIAYASRAKTPALTIEIKAVNFANEDHGSFEAVVEGKDAAGDQLLTPLVAPTFGISSSAPIRDGAVVSCKSAGRAMICKLVE